MQRDRKSIESKLNELRYFEFADSDSVIEETFKDYKNDGRINFPWNSLNRLFSIDAESLYESGGLESHAKDLVNLFEMFGINLIVGECKEEFDSDSDTYIKREVNINGKVYATPNVNGWGSAFKSGLELANDLLIDSNLKLKVYGLFMDENSTLIILNKEQFEYLNNLIPEGSDYRPIELGN